MGSSKTDPPDPVPSQNIPDAATLNLEPQTDSPLSAVRVKLIALLVSIGLIAVGLWLLGQEWGRNQPWIPWGILVVGFVLFLLSQRINPDKKLPEWALRVLNWWMTRFSLNGWQLVCLVISPVLSVVAFLSAGTGPFMNNPTAAIISWVAAILLVALAGLWNQFPARIQWNKWEWGLGGLLILSAAIIRGLYLENIPILLSGDEASSGLSAVSFIDGTTDNIFRMGWYSFPAFHNWLQSIPIRLFGQNIPALRLTSVVAGSLTVGVVYWTGKAIFSRNTGLYAAIFLAGFHFHHNFSRIGLNNIWDGLWFVLVLGTLWMGWHHQKRWAFVVSGLALGFAQYFYVTSRVLLALIPTWVIFASLTDRGAFRKKWPDLVLLGMSALVVVIPLAGFYLQNPNEFLAPMVRVSIMGDWLVQEVASQGKPGWQILLQQLGMSFLGIIYTPLRAWYMPEVPLLRTPSATLFLIGLGVLLLKPKDNRFLLLVLWILAICIPGGLSDSVPAAQRYVALSPALAIMVGFGLDQIAVQLAHLVKPLKRYFHLAVLLAATLLVLGELNFYFYVYTPRSDFGGANSLVAQRLADYLQSSEEDWEVLFWGYPRMGFYSIPSLQYLAPGVSGLDMNQPWGSSQNPTPTSDHLMFVFLPEHENQIPAVREDYPGGKLLQEYDKKGQTLYWLYEVSLGT